MEFSKRNRDLFLFDNRRKKANNFILENRNKFFKGSSFNIDMKNLYQNNIQGFQESYECSSIDQEIFVDQFTNTEITQMSSDIEEMTQKFSYYFERRNWNKTLIYLIMIREAISDERIGLSEIIQNEVISKILDILNAKYSELFEIQAEAAWVLANLSSGSSDDTKKLISIGLLPYLYDCLKFARLNEDLIENVLWTLANIAGEENFELREDIMKNNVIEFIINEFETKSKRGLFSKISAWLLSNLIRGPPYHTFDKIFSCPVLFEELFEIDDVITLEYTTVSLKYFCEHEDSSKIESILKHNLLNCMIKCLNPDNETICINILAAISSLSFKNEKISEACVDERIHLKFAKLLEYPSTYLRRQTLKTILSLVSEKNDLFIYKLTKPLVSVFIERISDDSEENKNILLRLLHDYSKICSFDDSNYLYERGIFLILTELIASDHQDNIFFGVKTIMNILKFRNDPLFSGGTNFYLQNLHEIGTFSVLEELRNYDDRILFELINYFLENYSVYY